MYIILLAGSFFLQYPRHGKLISINKRHTGKTNKEFNLRHDWNSLLSADEKLLFRHFSRDFFPHKSDLYQYMNAYKKRWSLNVKFETDVVDITRTEVSPRGDRSNFVVTDSENNRYTAR